MATIEAIVWNDAERCLELLDQRLLPGEEHYLQLRAVADVAQAIRDLVVRGAPAIGITAAYGAVLALQEFPAEEDRHNALDALREARPTAVNLAWAIDAMKALMGAGAGRDRLLEEARRIHAADIAANHALGEYGAALIEPGSRVLTHCNTGSLATGGHGTALGVIRTAYQQGRIQQVYAGETRPWLQGARLTAWELVKDQIPVQLVIEGAVATLFAQRKADWLIVGADRVVANGDTANKIGTYAAALHARHHGARVMVAIPSSTLDLTIASGDGIPIEERDFSEILQLGGQPIAARGAGAWNPVFDVTPAHLIDAIVTEHGVATPPFEQSLARIGSVRESHA